MPKLQEFLERGTFGPVAMGLSPLEVQERLGDPQEAGGKPKHRIWKYGSMQLAFERDRSTRTEAVSFIGFYFRDENLTLPKAIQLEGWFPSQRTMKGAFVRYLEEKGVYYSEDKLLSDETQSALRTRSGAYIIFACSAGEVVLDSIQLARGLKAADDRTIYAGAAEPRRDHHQRVK
jgi:hypothetical protein